uniref:Apolipoprotein Eb n=1 Tax=Scophthalmus maximus TaxID=52904 RepID=A0A8D2ZIL4_SCOMX
IQRLKGQFCFLVNPGCHARGVPQRDSRNPWEVTLDEFKDYFTDLSSKADGVVKDIKSSPVSRELDTLIQDSMSELATYREDLQTKLAPYTQEAAERLGTDLQKMADKLRKHMDEARQQMEKYTQELQTMMEQNAEDVRVRVSAYNRKMTKRLNKDSQEIKRHVAEYFEELQTRTSDNVGEMKTRFEPFLAQVQDNAQAKISTLNDLLKSQTDTMHFEKTSENMRSALEERMVEVRNWFQPYVSMIRDNL